MAAKRENRRILDREDTVIFIREVRQHNCLWDTKSYDYRNEILKDQRWNLVARQLRLEPEEAKKEWANLIAARKAAHNRRSALGEDIGKPWKFEEEMSFLPTQLPTQIRTPVPPRAKLHVQFSGVRKEENQNVTSGRPSIPSSAVALPQTPPACLREDRKREHPTASRVSSPINTFNNLRVEQIPNDAPSTSTPVSGQELEGEEPAPKKACIDINVAEELERVFHAVKYLLGTLSPEAQGFVLKDLENAVSTILLTSLKNYTPFKI